MKKSMLKPAFYIMSLSLILFFVVVSCQFPGMELESDDLSESNMLMSDDDDDDEDAKRIVAYYISWGIYARNFPVKSIPADRLTHVIYAFANVSDEGEIILGDPWADIYKSWEGDTPDQEFWGNFNQLVKLKKAYPHLKTLIAVGGWTWSGKFSDVALTDESRKRFAASCVDFIRLYKFDGIDIDWEYPGGGGLPTNVSRPEDTRNFTLLLKELRSQLKTAGREDGKKYLLTAATAAGADKIINLELDKIHKHLNWINLMTYDFHGGWDTVTNHLAPLYPNPADPSPDKPPAYVKSKYNVDSAVRQYLKGGVPSHKIVLGFPFYGRSWKGVPSISSGLFQPADGVPPGTWDNSGTFDFTDIEENFVPVYGQNWDNISKASWIYVPGDGIVITYESTRSCRIKTEYILERELGGAMFWEISADRNKTLLNIIYNALSDD